MIIQNVFLVQLEVLYYQISKPEEWECSRAYNLKGKYENLYYF